MTRQSRSHAADAANHLFKPTKKEVTDYEREGQAFQTNRERLKGERLAREAEQKDRFDKAR